MISDLQRMAVLRLQLADARHDALVLAMAVYHIPAAQVPAETGRVLEKYRRQVEDDLGISELSRDRYDIEPTDEQMERVADTVKTRALIAVDREAA